MSWPKTGKGIAIALKAVVVAAQDSYIDIDELAHDVDAIARIYLEHERADIARHTHAKASDVDVEAVDA